MDFDFYDKEFKPVGTVTVGRELMRKIMSIKTLPNLESNGEIPSDGSLDKEEVSDLITLSTRDKGVIGEELSELLSGEFHKQMKEKEEEKVLDEKEKSGKSNTQVVVELLSYLVNEDITHFRLG